MNSLLKKYTPNWINHFAQIKSEIENGLHGLEYNIEHVGSTAVPNLDSKPIIDIDIIYSDKADFENIKSGLEKLGITITETKALRIEMFLREMCK